MLEPTPAAERVERAARIVSTGETIATRNQPDEFEQSRVAAKSRRLDEIPSTLWSFQTQSQFKEKDTGAAVEAEVQVLKSIKARMRLEKLHSWWLTADSFSLPMLGVVESERRTGHEYATRV